MTASDRTPRSPGAGRSAAGSTTEEREGGTSDPVVWTRGHWFGPSGRPLLGWLTSAEGRPSTSGVLILPPVGYSYWSSHWTLRVLAERLAARGHLALRLDYESTGDSAGDQWEPGRFGAWRQSVTTAAAELRARGCSHLTIVGVQLGATFALLDGGELAEAVVAWAPVVTGRRFAREIRARSLEVPGDALPPDLDGAMVLAGTVFAADTLAALSQLDLSRDVTATPARVLLVGEAAPPELIDHLTSLGGSLEQREIAGGETALAWASEDAIVPEAIVKAIADWIGTSGPSSGEAVPTRPEAAFTWHGERLREQVAELTSHQLVGIRSEPEDERAVRAGGQTVVFLNTGSETHTGPGRAWVEYARALAACGYRCLRVDYRGWGESPDEGHAPGRPYDPHCEEDTLAIIRSLRSAGHEQISLVGLCASAWMALRAVLREPVTGVIALNPQMYWRMGDPVEALLQDTRARRTPERERQERWERVGLWTALDHLGHRPWAGRWLDDLAASPTPVTLVFAAGDDGLEFLQTRVRRRLQRVQRAAGVEIVEVPGIDHSMHRAWLRPAIIELLLRTLDRQARARD